MRDMKDAIGQVRKGIVDCHGYCSIFPVGSGACVSLEPIKPSNLCCVEAL